MFLSHINVLTILSLSFSSLPFSLEQIKTFKKSLRVQYTY